MECISCSSSSTDLSPSASTILNLCRRLASFQRGATDLSWVFPTFSFGAMSIVAQILQGGYSEVPRAAPAPPVPAANPPPVQPALPPGGPNANPLDLFPQGIPSVGSGNAPGNNLHFLRNSPQFRALQSMVQANPHILQPMLQELVKQNPQLIRLIQEHQADFVEEVKMRRVI